ncbi:M12 family metallo-peptidase [Flavobacterium solisilvae]|uniref:T9SS type A sorting domain-containing protein n=1 Tax=Flavobacterium solisilvae TaxID=1852019 RepID=A0ABX1QUC8_9FLAO|nr:M12 family metallo-peptidase [Flavobacterium solisilvae]NMH24794.1 T9SS type A sorting domain-containing protein [Flavobacterium solisilvae]
MKKQLLVLMSLFAFSLFGQKKIAEQVTTLQDLKTSFKKVSVLTPDVTINKSDVEKVVNDATLAKLNVIKLNQIFATKDEFLELDIPYKNQVISVLLYKVNPFTEDFQIDTDKSKNIAYQKGVYYRGIIKNDINSVSSFNFFNGEFNGIISSESLGNLVIGKLDKKGNQLDYIVYSDSKMNIINNWSCHVKEDDDTKVEEVLNSNREINTAKCVTFYFEVDFTLFTQNGSDTTATTNWMTSVFNNVQTLFNNDGITTALKSMFIWTSQDIYEGIGTSSGIYLSSFAQNRPIFNGDVAMLVGIDPGGLGGVAYLDSICANNNYSYSDVDFSFSSVPSFSWTVQVITHEFGHSLGSPHTHRCSWNGNNTSIDGCGTSAGYPEGNCPQGPIPSSSVKGTIMSYCHLVGGVGISFTNGFGPQPTALIQNNVNSKTCLSTDCVNTCINNIVNIQASNITNNGVTATWDDVGDATTWQVMIRPANAVVGGTWNTVTAKTFTISTLNPNTYYRIRIRPICTGINATIRERVFATNGDYCGGMLFTDSGGLTGNYTNGEDFTRKMIPNESNQKLVATFTSFNLEDTYDFLYIYNGPDDTYPEFNAGVGFTGVNSPGTITSTAADGSLTFKFISDGATEDSGWNATISCTPSLGISNNDFIDFSYYPNPTNGNLNIKSNTSISEITVFNIEGRRLFNQTLDTLETSVDISQFATGTYFFKLKFGEKEANFKVLKM